MGLLDNAKDAAEATGKKVGEFVDDTKERVSDRVDEVHAEADVKRAEAEVSKAEADRDRIRHSDANSANVGRWRGGKRRDAHRQSGRRDRSRTQQTHGVRRVAIIAEHEALGLDRLR